MFDFDVVCRVQFFALKFGWVSLRIITNLQ